MTETENESRYPIRKPTRLKAYDYSQNGCYFVTVCVKDKKPILSRIVGGDALIAPRIELTQIGKIVDWYIQNINTVYTDVTIENYIIMPNHIHLLIGIDGTRDGTMWASSAMDSNNGTMWASSATDMNNGTMWASSPTTNLSTVIRSLKTMVTKEIGKSVWQRSFYDEIIKNEMHFQSAWNYIEYNALKEYAGKNPNR